VGTAQDPNDTVAIVTPPTTPTQPQSLKVNTDHAWELSSLSALKRNLLLVTTDMPAFSVCGQEQVFRRLDSAWSTRSVLKCGHDNANRVGCTLSPVSNDIRSFFMPSGSDVLKEMF
jgi:hypothetical protein